MTLLTVATIVLAILKWFELIAISWWWVFTPLFIQIAVTLIAIIVLVTMGEKYVKELRRQGIARYA